MPALTVVYDAVSTAVACSFKLAIRILLTMLWGIPALRADVPVSEHPFPESEQVKKDLSVVNRLIIKSKLWESYVIFSK